MRSDGIISSSAMDAIALQLREDAFNETVWDFAKGTGKPCGASHISAAYTCRLSEGERESIISGLAAKGGSVEKLNRMNDEQLSRVNKLVKEKGLGVDSATRSGRAVEVLAATKSGGKQKSGDEIMEPSEAKKYAKFYEDKKDLSYKPPYDTNPAEVKATLAQLKEEMPAEDYRKLLGRLEDKGKPSPEQKAEWNDKGGGEARREAVLKSLMDNDFKTVTGEEVSWNSGMQLDHKVAGSVGGKDDPSNWIWISIAANQTKMHGESAVKQPKWKNATAKEKEAFIRSNLVRELKENAKMSSAEVASRKAAGVAREAAKTQDALAVRDNFPLMTPSQRASRIDAADTPTLQSMLKGSLNTEAKNPATGRRPAYRMAKGSNRGARGNYPTKEQMRSLMRLRWGEKLRPQDIKQLNGMVTRFAGDGDRGKKLDEILGNWPPTTGLTAAERIAILRA